MLCYLRIKNFALIDQLDLELRPHMTVITGETGAGKSIIIDALSIALGHRADSASIRNETDHAMIEAIFDITHILNAKQWLIEQELQSGNECIIRRTISSEGRSRHTINGYSVTLQQLKTLGKYLVHIHGQHQHQALLEREEQRAIVDHFADHPSLLQTVRQLYHQWHEHEQQIQALKKQDSAPLARIDLLHYQIAELQELALEVDEVDRLHQEQRELVHGEELIASGEKALALIAEGSELNALNCLHGALQSISAQKQLHPRLNTVAEFLQQAMIHTQEAADELQHFLDAVLDKKTADPQRLPQIEQRLDKINQVARKHRLKPEELIDHEQQLTQELSSLLHRDEKLASLQSQASELLKQYQHQCFLLHQSRLKAAGKISEAVTGLLQQLSLKGSYLHIECQHQPEASPSLCGLDDIQLTISTNPGSPPQPLAKIASGGELSRISLAIQVITAQKEETPTLIFDEVDVGISGATAEIVGQLLHQLGHKAQVLCITHLPQVAAQGAHHLKISKQTLKNQTTSHLNFLTREKRIEEMARMLGGLKITQQTLAHAEEMLSLSVSELL